MVARIKKEENHYCEEKVKTTVTNRETRKREAQTKLNVRVNLKSFISFLFTPFFL
jgi:hypothetical protein